MNCLIVDDEPQARKLLSTYISSIPGCVIGGVCRSAMEAYEALQTGKIDLLFLDIKMPVISGTDFLRSLKNPPLVIFTTAFDKYAMEGYELNVVDYLLKPIALPRLLQAVDKAWARYKERIFVAAPPAPDYTFVRQEHKLVKVLFSDIRFVEGMQNYIKLHLTTGSMMVSSTMKAFEKILPDGQFIRIHRSYIASIAFITAIRNNQVEMRDLDLPVGLSFKDDLLKSINNGSEPTG
ncbi:LytR/AlgR family response regulator transcription factor [Paraflavitalea pollutisoli]|uniref:LytR/AlgR family response regulator transcription factor n=1 Tax=Paraflavitalea pollutisoli TaxID=3034143 RepID=UPI0023EAA45A|nr:LytTR family DNA-binding domain-containing protein [Paraflavitalea sp. H1-2-19X]